MLELICYSIALVAGTFVTVVWCVHAITMSRSEARQLVPISWVVWIVILVALIVVEVLAARPPIRMNLVASTATWISGAALMFVVYALVTGVALTFRRRVRRTGFTLAAIHGCGLASVMAVDQLTSTM